LKAIDALNVFNLFRGVGTVSEFTSKEKAEVGKELLALYPNAALFPNSDATIEACKRIIAATIADLEATDGREETRASTAPTAKALAPKSEKAKHLRGASKDA
jgi:hypothetical protein